MGSVDLVAGRREQGYQRVHNLTVEGIHTYHVMADNTPVLVHNCGGGEVPHFGSYPRPDVGFTGGNKIHYMFDVNGNYTRSW
ncbi:hypothetical protein BU204_01535 [Actinophytocola xanthii]|uniref:Uncharacterized protein n=1 Tax=Actinophytocola xanthii TaxID=1912961 RepID=A0A1Q8CZ55_9PSEU|nr:hypothetical protein BU204_01535 [Actinophytocola xanthii]